MSVTVPARRCAKKLSEKEAEIATLEARVRELEMLLEDADETITEVILNSEGARYDL